ncbi:S8 family serine peptidase [Actinoallomurus sp. NPDC052308]|uniref:S8 family serine peptidase n=1 Tax=Actinoallomurus sp. NPDC052308 TaxID=3155530 RepID=UPI00344AE7CE
MPVSEPRRTFPRLVSALLAGAAVAVLSIPAAQSAVPGRPQRPAVRTATADLFRGQQWTLGALHLPRAWKYSRGNGVTVAVLDTGVDGHQPDLTGRVIDGPDFTGHARKPGTRYWGRHGTEMASLIAGHGHGTGGSAGIMGVAPEAKVLSIRVTWELGDPMRNDHAQVAHSRDSIARGIRYATDHGAQVISMSLGGGKLFYNGNPLEESAIKYALDKGVVLVASSGNDGATGNRRNYPAAYPGVIAVGAVDRAFKPAKFTNRHAYVSVAAPGVEIVSADVAGHGYVLGTGTSSSAALVAGVSALVKARYPHLSAAEVKQALEQGTTHHPADGRNPAIGTGVADALGSLRAAARINKAEHGGATVDQPQSSSTRPGATGHPAGGGPDLMLVAVLSGGGTLLVLSLILGWRQRRRRLARAAADAEEDLAPPVAASSRAEDDPRRPRPPAHPPRQGGSSGRSPWEPRTSETPSPWEPRPTRSPSPWEPRSPEPPSPWESRSPEPSSAREPLPPDLTPGLSGRPDVSPRPGQGEPGSATARWRSRQSDPPPGTPASPGGGIPDAGPPPASGSPDPAPFSRTSGRSPAEPSPWSGTAPAEPPRTEPFAAPAWSPAADRAPSSGPGLPPAADGRLPSGTGTPPATGSVPSAGPGVPPAADGGLPSGPEVPSAAGGRPSSGPPSFVPPAGPASPAESSGAPDEPSPADPVRPPSAPERRPIWTPPGERGDETTSGGRFPDVRGADPLSDGPIDSSAVGTPLADESWDSIHRGFDRLKEDTRNWGSPLNGGMFGWSSSWSSSEEPADPPPAEPDDDSET